MERDISEERKRELLKRIEVVLGVNGFNPEVLGVKTVHELLEEISIYHQELEYQNHELHRAQEELEISQKHFQDLFDKAPVGYVLTNEDFLILRANFAFGETTGMAVNLMKGKPLNYFVDPESQDDFYLLCRQLNASYSGGDKVIRILRNNAESAVAKVSTKRLAPATTFLYLFVFSDISYEQKAINDLNEARALAMENDKLKTAFLNNISHEVRTPLNGILGFLDILKDSNLSPSERETYTRIVVQNSQQLLSIISEIVQISTIETGQEKLNETETDINELIQEASLFYKERAEQKGLHFECHPLPENISGMVQTDRDKLYHLLSALLNNAVKFTHSGKISCKVFLSGNVLHFQVSDTGIGIPKPYHQVIFDRFRQVFPTRDREYGGNGLGLAIARAYVELMKGKIWVESEPGQGSVFTFTIPYQVVTSAIASKAPDKENVLKTELTGYGKTVLIVEDEWSNFLLLSQILQKAGFRVLHSTNGKEAVETCQEHLDIHLVLMDLKLPVLNGYEATRLIKTRNPHLPVIAITAYALTGDREKAMAAGCDDYVSKPLNKNRITEILKQYLA